MDKGEYRETGVNDILIKAGEIFFTKNISIVMNICYIAIMLKFNNITLPFFLVAGLSCQVSVADVNVSASSAVSTSVRSMLKSSEEKPSTKNWNKIYSDFLANPSDTHINRLPVFFRQHALKCRDKVIGGSGNSGVSAFYDCLSGERYVAVAIASSYSQLQDTGFSKHYLNELPSCQAKFGILAGDRNNVTYAQANQVISCVETGIQNKQYALVFGVSTLAAGLMAGIKWRLG